MLGDAAARSFLAAAALSASFEPAGERGGLAMGPAGYLLVGSSPFSLAPIAPDDGCLLVGVGVELAGEYATAGEPGETGPEVDEVGSSRMLGMRGDRGEGPLAAAAAAAAAAESLSHEPLRLRGLRSGERVAYGSASSRSSSNAPSSSSSSANDRRVPS